MATRIWTPVQRQRQTEAIWRRKPWKQSTAPKTAQAKAKVLGNGYTASEWANLRQAIKALNQALREQKQLIR
jgi:uncharacterized protein with NRDE domain